MAIFGPKPWVNISTFWTSYFYSLEKRFFALKYRKRHFPNLYCLKKNLEKWPFLDQNHVLTPLEKCQFFNVLNVLFYSLERRFFALKYRNRHFTGLYCLKKKVGKMAIFGLKPWVNAFGKVSIYRLFELLVFIA